MRRRVEKLSLIMYVLELKPAELNSDHWSEFIHVNGSNTVRLFVGNKEGDRIEIHLTRDQALQLAGALQGHALLLK